MKQAIAVARIVAVNTELKSKVVATEAVGIYSKSKLTNVPLQVAGERVAVTVRVCVKEKFTANKKINVKLFNFNKIYT